MDVHDAAERSSEFTGHAVILGLCEIERGRERAGLRLLFEGNISAKMCEFKHYPLTVFEPNGSLAAYSTRLTRQPQRHA